MATQTQTTTTTTTTMEEFSYEDLEEATNNFSLSSLIGKGSHGCVYKGQNLHAQLSNKHFNIVAIKKSSLGLQILQDNSKLDNEIDVLSSLPSSPYLVNLIGLSRRHDNSATTLNNNNNNNKVLVMEFMPNSSLHHLLHHTESTQPSWPTRALIALQLARALQFLHDLPESSVVHRDVKPSNILFDSNWNAKLADFGLALRLQTTESPLHDSPSPPAGTIGYIDPSYTTPSKLSVKNDVYSFGVVLLEIVSSRRAIDVEMDPASIVEWALPLIKADRMDGIIDRRAIPPAASMRSSIKTMLSVAARCVELEQSLRPSMREVVTELMNSVLVNVERTRFPPLIKSLMWISRRHRRRKEAARTTVILCRAQDQGEVSSAKMSIREVLAETQ